jgi:hypothetical protein
VCTSGGAALLQGHELFGAESLVVDLAGGFNEVLKVGAGQEVAKVHEFAVVLVFNVDHTPAVLAAAHLFSVDNNVLLASDDGEGDNILALIRTVAVIVVGSRTYFDLDVQPALLVIQLIIVIGVHLQVVESEFLLDSLLECLSLFQGQGVGLGNNGDNVHNVGKLLEDDNIDGLKARNRSVSRSNSSVEVTYACPDG